MDSDIILDNIFITIDKIHIWLNIHFHISDTLKQKNPTTFVLTSSKEQHNPDYCHISYRPTLHRQIMKIHLSQSIINHFSQLRINSFKLTTSHNFFRGNAKPSIGSSKKLIDWINEIN